jgi:hypothetical protein
MWMSIQPRGLESARLAAYSVIGIRHDPQIHRANITFIIFKESFFEERCNVVALDT